MGLSPITATEEEWSAAQRLCDAVNLQLQVHGAEAHGKYVAVKLADGRGDGVLYDTRRDATRHQSDPWCFYVKVNVGGIQPREAWTVLMYARQAKRAGIVFTEEEVILPHRLELGGGWVERALAAAFPGVRDVA
jgi:hypothetical protein